MKIERVRKKIIWLEWCALAIAYIHHIFYIYRYIDRWLDGDLSAELIEGKILAQEGGLVAKDWIYSTELRVLNIPQVFAIFFRFIDNWHLVRVISSAVWIAILLASVIFLAIQLEIKHYPLLALIFILPFSRIYMDTVIYGLYYIPHIATCFLIIAAILYMLKNDDKKKLILIMTASVLLSFFTGLGGPRLILLLYLPLLLCIVQYTALRWNAKSIRSICLTAGIVIAAMLGYMINSKLLSRIYSFEESRIEISRFDLQTVSEIISEILIGIGYTTGEINRVSLFNNILCVSICIFMIYSCLFGRKEESREKHIFYQTYLQIAFLVMSSFFIFTITKSVNTKYIDISGSNIAARYLYPVTLLFFPYIFYKMERDRKDIIKVLSFVIIYALLLINSFNLYTIYKYSYKTKGLQAVIEYLQENEYTEGYSTWRYAYPIVELSHGGVDVWMLEQEQEGLYVWPWLQTKTHLTSPPDGKFFVLFERDEWLYPIKEIIVDEPIYEDDSFIIWGYQDYDMFIQQYGSE